MGAHYQAAAVVYNHQLNQMGEIELPERPQLACCEFYMRTGHCAYGPTCRWHHPKERAKPGLNSQGYPLHPTQADCSYYRRTGKCAFGGAIQRLSASLLG